MKDLAWREDTKTIPNDNFWKRKTFGSTISRSGNQDSCFYASLLINLKVLSLCICPLLSTSRVVCG